MRNGNDELQDLDTFDNPIKAIEYSENIISEIDFWLGSVSFNKFYNDIKKDLIGQENLKILLANIYNYLSNILNCLPINHNIILSAPSGAGKTETYRILKKYFAAYIPSLPVYIQDLSRITATGYKGMDPSDLLTTFYNKHFKNAIGIVFLDEFDKKLIPSFNGMGQDTNREAQSCLLTLVEGSVIQNKLNEEVDTSNIMFIGLGSFNECREQAKYKPLPLGFNSQIEENESYNIYQPITKKDMINAGGLYELIGRFPIIINYNALDNEGIKNIVNKIILAISESYDCKIVISDGMMEYLIKEGNSDFGCRLIDSIIRQSVLTEYTKALEHPNYDKRLKIVFESNERVTHSWTNFSKKELEEKRCLKAFEQSLNVPMFTI